MSPCTAKLSAYKNKHFLKYVLSSITATPPSSPSPHLHRTHHLVSPSITPNKRVYIHEANPDADNGEKTGRNHSPSLPRWMLRRRKLSHLLLLLLLLLLERCWNKSRERWSNRRKIGYEFLLVSVRKAIKRFSLLSIWWSVGRSVGVLSMYLSPTDVVWYFPEQSVH